MAQEYHNPNTYEYVICIEKNLIKNIYQGNIIANSRSRALDKLVQKYECDRNIIKLKCIPCLETSHVIIKLCPKCKSELIQDEICYSTFPPQYNYICKKCGYKVLERG